MAEASAMNSDGKRGAMDSNGIKKEEEVAVKSEPVECVVCGARGAGADIYTTLTTCGTTLCDFLGKHASSLAAAASRHLCRACHDLVDILEQAELEYFKLKDTFEALISKNPLFEQNRSVSTVKVEYDYDNSRGRSDSEDEPLAVTRKKRPRKAALRKKKLPSAPKRRKPRVKISVKDRGDCKIEEEQEEAESAEISLVKKEESVDGSEGSQFTNGLDNVFKELEGFQDDDTESCFSPDDEEEAPRRGKARRGRPRKVRGVHPLLVPIARKKRTKKVQHSCTECDVKYTSLRKLELHLESHAGGKPPYICEVCGARYKHKRACDIHVALHKGISDWKCEECDKLFPSKGALQRHNNIHTGKLNYQCDLCGKSFIHTSSFKMHKLSHSGVKPHACDVCGLALMTRSHLKRHKRVHSGEKRHECAVCGKRFSERYNLAAHSKSHEAPAPGAPEPAAPAHRKLFRCTFCQERFERRYMLERHMSLAHGRTLERVPPTPRNTMSKLLKAQAQARQAPPAAPEPDPKEERSPEPRAGTLLHKLHLSSSSMTITASSWSGAYAAEFGLRTDYPH